MFNTLGSFVRNYLLGIPLSIVLVIISSVYLAPILSLGVFYTFVPLFIFFSLTVGEIISISVHVKERKNKTLNKLFVTVFLPITVLIILLSLGWYSQIILSFAKSSGNYSLCSRVLNDPRGILENSCYYDIAIAKNDIEGCKYISESDRWACYLKIARNTHNPNLCKYPLPKDGIFSYDKYWNVGRCIEEFTKYQSVELCIDPEATMGNQVVQDSCFSEYAMWNGKSFCSRIVDKKTQEACLR